jgi:hypothetical protein
VSFFLINSINQQTKVNIGTNDECAKQVFAPLTHTNVIILKLYNNFSENEYTKSVVPNTK